MEDTNKSELFTELSKEQSETVQGGCYGYSRRSWGGGWGGYYRPVSYYRPYYSPRSYWGGGYGCRRWYY